MAKATDLKCKISGTVVEFWEYEKPIFLEGNGGGGRRKREEDKSEKTDEYKKQNDRRSKAEFRSLVLSNFDDGSKFVTLTFKDTKSFDVRSVKDCNKQFDNFIKRMRRRYGDFKYIRVLEFQDKNKRGAIHYHLIADLPYIKHDDLAAIWGLGYVGINYIKGVDNIGAYISKYMSKDMGDIRLEGRKNWTKSQNMIEPVVLYGSQAREMLKKLKNEQKKEVFKDCYESEHFGNISYNEYNLKRANGTIETKIGKNLKEKMIADEKIKSMQKNNKIDKDAFIKEFIEMSDKIAKGEYPFDRRVLEDVQRRAAGDVRKRRNRVDFFKEILVGLSRYKPEQRNEPEWKEYKTSQEYWEEQKQILLAGRTI